jgi:RecG-like helicase
MLINKYQIIWYFRRVEDLMLYNPHTTNTDNALDKFNQLKPKLKLTIENETNNKINYLDLTIINNKGRIEFNIYRKPAATDLNIRNNSTLPIQHKKCYQLLNNRPVDGCSSKT